jgi:dimethylaniline monooxygenase (N-oxide forming)
VAIVGAGPGGLTAAKHSIEAGFDTTVFEASDDLGGQWHTHSAHSGVWPGMHTNTSRGMTAFSDFPPPRDFPLHPSAEQIRAYLNSYATRYGVPERIRFNTTVTSVRPAWFVNSEPFDALVVASGRFSKPRMVPVTERFEGELLHAFHYRGAEGFRGRRTLIYGNGISGHEIASDIAAVSPVTSAYRKPRYVLQKVVDGVPSDWQWYTHFGALQRRTLPPALVGAALREQVVRVAGNPRDFGAPEPDVDILIAGHSLCQDYLEQVRQGRISCRPEIASVDGHTVTFVDGSSDDFDALICATGYQLHVPYLAQPIQSTLGPEFNLYQRTLHPGLPHFGAVGLFTAQGPYFPLLELQARLIIAIWAGEVEPPEDGCMRHSLAEPSPAVEPHHVFAMRLSEELGVAPDLRARPDLTQGLLFGPMLPARYRLDGPGATADAAANLRAELAATPRPAVTRQDISGLAHLGLADLLCGVD